MRTYIIALIFISFQSWADSVKDLELKLKRVESSIQLTRDKIKSPQDVEFLPDLYFMMAELLVDKARIAISLKQAMSPKTPLEELDFTAEKRAKLEAVEIYKQIEGRFPKYQKLDKVLFFLAHEYRELNQDDNALQIYKRITDSFPNSSFWDEAQLNIGNSFFDKKDFDFAIEQYKKITSRPTAKTMSAAFYKIGWCHINKSQWQLSFEAFENSIKAYNESKEKFSLRELKSSDMQEEALVASVWPYTELLTSDLKSNQRLIDPIAYYRSLSPDKFTFAKVMKRLGRRLALKRRFTEAANSYYQAFLIVGDPNSKMDILEDYYDAFKSTPGSFFPAELAESVADTFIRMKELEVGNSKKRLPKFEPILRDIATSMHKAAMSTKRKDDLLNTARAYEEYLYIFPDSKYTSDMQINLAESYYHAGAKIEASQVYWRLAQMPQNSRTKEHYSSSAQSLVEGLANSESLSPLEKFQGRARLKALGGEFAKRFPDDKMNQELRFNIGKVLYDERNFIQATSYLKNFLKVYPNSAKAEQVALLYLDCFYQQEKLKDLVSEGNALTSNNRIAPATRAKIKSVISEAQLKRVRSIAGDFNSKKYADKMLQLANSQGGPSLAEPALYEAFLSLKATGDPKVFSVGQSYLAKVPENEKSKAILTTLIQLALISTDFERAAAYLETYAQRYQNDPQAGGFADQAIQIYRKLGRYDDAASLAKQRSQNNLALSLLAEGRRWNSLNQMAGKDESSQSIYYHALSLLKVGKPELALPLFNRFVQSASGEKALLAHANYILSKQHLKVFFNFGLDQAMTPALIKEKINHLGIVEGQVQRILSTQDPKWIVGGLGIAGRANQEMAKFLVNANPPPGMTKEKFVGIMTQQAQQYKVAADNYFKQCLQLVEDNNLFTGLTSTCLKRAETRESILSEESPSYLFSQDSLSPNIQKALMEKPRSIKDLQMRLQMAKSKNHTGLVELVLQRLMEIEGEDSIYGLENGFNYLKIGFYDSAANVFSKMQNSPRAILDQANWGLAAMYYGLSRAQKYEQIRSRVKGTKKPQGMGISWLDNISGSAP